MGYGSEKNQLHPKSWVFCSSQYSQCHFLSRTLFRFILRTRNGVQNLPVFRLQDSWHGGCYNGFQDQPGRRGIGFTILGEGVNLGTTGLFLLFLLNGGAVRRVLFDARRQQGLKKWRLRFARDNGGFDFREARFFEHALEFDFRKS